jgi:glucosamine-phosphate N-acetyltransferase
MEEIKSPTRIARVVSHLTALPSGLVMRRLEASDFGKGFLEVLGQLSQVGDVTREMFETRFKEMEKCPGTYYTLVIEDTSKQRIIAAATLFVEIKIMRSCGKVGHVEDVVVDSAYRGKDLGARIVQGLNALAKDIGCYKIILACSDKNVPFYEKLGYILHSNSMALYFDESEHAKAKASPQTERNRLPGADTKPGAPTASASSGSSGA